MRKYLLFTIFLAANFFEVAKSQSKTEHYDDPDETYGSRATKTTTVSKDEKLNKIIKVEIKNNKDIPVKRTEWKNDILNNWTVKVEHLTPSGKVFCSQSWKYDASGKLTGITCQRGSRVDVYERTPEGTLKEKSDKASPISADAVKMGEEDFLRDLKEMEEEIIPSLEAPKSACSCSEGNCQTKFVAFAGPSVLFSDYGQESETFFGGHIAALFNVSTHIGIGADVSLHSKKFGTENLTRGFYMVEGRYVFGDVKNCSQTFTGDIHVLAGLGTEKYGDNSASGFAYGAGGSVEIRITNNFGVKGQLDFLGVKLGDTDETNKNIRASIGVIFRAQRSYQP